MPKIRVLFFKVADMFYLPAVEERAASSRTKPGEGEERGQPGVSEERPAAVHLPAIWQREAGASARHSHNAAAQSRGEKQTGCHRTRYVVGEQSLQNVNNAAWHPTIEPVQCTPILLKRFNI